MFDYDPMAAFNAECLDKIPNFREYLINNRGATQYELMDIIQNACDDHEWPENVEKIFCQPPFRGDVFEFLTNDEFMEYCSIRYKVRWEEEIKYYLLGGDCDYGIDS